MKVLIVEDNEDGRNLLTKQIRAYGYEVTVAADGVEALTRALTDRPDIVVSDIQMPKMDGYQLCHEWKQNDSLKNIPFVFYTATYTSNEDEKFALSLGADAFIRKPADPEMFIQILSGLFEKASSGLLIARETEPIEPSLYLSEYNKRLIAKLDKKIKDLEREVNVRKKAENALKESTEKYRLLYENSNDAILQTTPDGCVLAANPAACRMFGRTEQELREVGRNGVIDVTDPRFEAALEQRNRTGEFKGELTLIRGDGSKFTGEVSSKLFTDSSGNVKTSMIIRDVTERKRVEEENMLLREKAEKSSRLASVGEMAAGIAHEISNPLTGVIGFSELLMSEELPPDIKEQIKIIADGSNRVKDIVRRMLTFARQTKSLKTRVNINELISATLDLRSYVLRTANIEVFKCLDTDLPMITVDPGQMQQVFLNIIVNAEYAMKKAHGKGILTITTEKKDDHIHISFKDDGIGMSPEVKGTIFDPFFTTKDPGEGTGLGLSLSRSIIMEHGGIIEVESAPDKGADFIITLPVTSPREESLAEARFVTTKSSKKIKSARILAVDDEEAITCLVSKILTQSGHSVDTAGGPEEVWLKLGSNNYDIIVMDIRMPGLSGMEMYTKILEKYPKLSGKFIFMTGDTSDHYTRAFLRQNGLSYITKPFDRSSLLQKVEMLLY